MGKKARVDFGAGCWVVVVCGDVWGRFRWAVWGIAMLRWDCIV